MYYILFFILGIFLGVIFAKKATKTVGELVWFYMPGEEEPVLTAEFTKEIPEIVKLRTVKLNVKEFTRN